MIKRALLLLAGMMLLYPPASRAAEPALPPGWFEAPPFICIRCASDGTWHSYALCFIDSGTLGTKCATAYNGNGPGAPQTACAVTGAGDGPTGPTAAIRHASPSGATAFVYTPPYRLFAQPALNFGTTTPNPTLQCDAGVNPNGFTVYHSLNVVARINFCTSAQLAAINVTSNPLQVQVTPDGKWGIVTSYDNAISFINTDTNTVDKVIQTDANTFPAGLAISPDGDYALVTSYIDVNPVLLVIDVHTQAVTKQIPLDRQYPQSVFLSRDATLAWVTYPYASAVEVIDVMTGIVNASILVNQPMDIVFNPTGTVAYISDTSAGSVKVVNTTTYSLLKEVTTDSGAAELLLSPDGSLLTVNNSSSITSINTATLTVNSTTSVSGPPTSVAVVPVQ